MQRAKSRTNNRKKYRSNFKNISNSKTNQNTSKLNPLNTNINSKFKNKNTKKKNKILNFNISFINSYFKIKKNYNKLLPSNFLNKLKQTYKTKKNNNNTSSFNLITKLKKFKLSNSLLDPIILKPNQKLFFSSTNLQKKNYLTNNKNKTIKILEIKGRKLEIKNFYEGVIKFDFEELCNRNLGSEDFISIANNCDFLLIVKLPNFSEDNSNQQQRFITLIDI